MEKKQKDTEVIRNNESELKASILTLKRGNTTFQIGVQFSPHSKETLDEKLKRLLEKEVKNMKNAS